ncbi:glycosyltransferase family 4 protein [uncultured Pontibacter sp.]|uniref:glycosyltransferase family 4 protein n=1 Tax=uncultured Pontibacter sp. TaxID=453356 RepID=UPI0026146D70|nr:glycosyltransferase family 4 protein [uncultured Pontibacter sp.]
MPAQQEKIIFIIQRVGVGGAEFFLKTIVNSFIARGIEPILILLSDDNPILNQFDPGIRLYVVPRRYRYDFSVSKRIREIVLTEGVCKVFCIGAFAFFMAKLRLLQHTNIAFYLSLHTTVPFTFKNYVMDTLYLRLLGSNDTAIFICKNQKDYYRSKYYFKAKKSFVIYNGIDTSHYFANNLSKYTYREDTRLTFKIPADAKVIVNVANVKPEKGHIYAIEALSILHEKLNNKAHLLIVGEAKKEAFESLKQSIVERKLMDYVHFAGIQEDVRPYLAAADIFTLTSFSETFSLAAIEAMSFGLPCVLTDVGGAAEMIVENKNGLLCEARNPLSIANSWHKMLNSKVDNTYIMELAAGRFSAEQMIDNYLEVLVGEGQKLIAEET